VDTFSEPTDKPTARLEVLRRTLEAAIACGGSFTADEVDAAVNEALDAWEAQSDPR